MTFAGLDHVILSRHAELDRTVSSMCENSGHTGTRCRLGFFASKSAAHSANFYLYLVDRQGQYFRHQFLDFSWMLGRTDYMHPIFFVRDS